MQKKTVFFINNGVLEEKKDFAVWHFGKPQITETLREGSLGCMAQFNLEQPALFLRHEKGCESFEIIHCSHRITK